MENKPTMPISEDELVAQIMTFLEQGRNTVLRQTNHIMTLTYFEIGKYIVEYEQHSQVRAKYAKKTLTNLSTQLANKFGKGFSVDNLQNMRRFYVTYQNYETVFRKSDMPFALSWSHYLFLLGVDKEAERRFYEMEAHKNKWSLRELKRQFNSALYERLALSTDKEGVLALSRQGQIIIEPKDAVKDPYILEFLGLDEKARYSESELEQAIINNLEHFLLELGNGFFFVGRQKRITFAEKHFYIDLVFYHRFLRCFVLLDLKIGELTHENLGQMQIYVNYYDREVRQDDENPTIGIVLCKHKNESVVEFTLPENNQQIFASKYALYIPSKEELRRQIENM